MKMIVGAMIGAIVLAPQAAPAQTPAASQNVVVTSEPGKATIVEMSEVTATVTGIDKATRTVTLKGPQRTLDVVADDEVRNFDQLRLGQKVSVRYRRALSLELRKSHATPTMATSEVTTRSKPGELPGGSVGRAVTVIADVVAVDPKKSTISLKGPRGNVVDLQVGNPDQFKVVKKGDQVEALYFEALAVAVTPVTPAPAK